MLRTFLHCTHPPKVDFARHLRREQTAGEIALWRQLRAKRFHGIKLRRQVPIGPFIVDFLCAEKKLIIEIDGETHDHPRARARDAWRETFLRKQGNEPPLPEPSPDGGGGSQDAPIEVHWMKVHRTSGETASSSRTLG